MRRLEDRLAANSCEMPLEKVQDVLVDLMADQYSAWSVDELLLHPREASQYCDLARRRLDSPGLPDDLILRCLINRRKNPER